MSNSVNETELPPILTEEHMAALHGVAVRTLYDMRQRPNWPFTELPRMGKKPRWSRNAVLNVINSNGSRNGHGRAR